MRSHNYCWPEASFFRAAGAADAANSDLDRTLAKTVRPFLTSYCVGCHGGAAPAAQFDLGSYSTMAAVTRDYPRWNLVLEKLTAREMPPKPAPQPPDEARQQVIDWMQAVRTNEARKNAGDPGPVLARRLSNAEYNNTIRDLTGVDMRPTREFPVDPANTAGFDNSGESLTMSPALLNKYLQAAREVGDHMVLTPDGFDFAPHPMLVETDRDSYAIQRIVDFYERQPTDYADYFQAAWRFKYRAALGTPGATLAGIAAESKVSAKYLPMIWGILEETHEAASQEVGPIAKLQAMWRALAAAARKAGRPGAPRRVRRDARFRGPDPPAHRDAVRRARGARIARRIAAAAELEAARSSTRTAAISTPRRCATIPTRPRCCPRFRNIPVCTRKRRPAGPPSSTRARAGDPDLVVPAAERARYRSSFARFASVFPDAFYVKERGRFFPDDSQDKGRLLSAGYHNVMGYWRDDTPLMELILDAQGQEGTRPALGSSSISSPITRPAPGSSITSTRAARCRARAPSRARLRPADKAVSSEAVIFGLRDAYLAKAEPSQ